MNPVLVTWRGGRIHSYPVLLYLGMVCGIVVGDYVANVAGLNSARALLAMVLLTIPGLVGARLLFVATNWHLYRDDRARIWRRSEGGAAMQGGLLLAVVVSVPLLGVLGLSFGGFWDAATFAALIQLVFARIGCLLHGCCAGRPAEGWFALSLPDHRGVWQRRVPSQLLEAGWAVLILIGAAAWWSDRPFPGAVFLAALSAYVVGRVALEPLRESRTRIGGLDVQRALAAMFGVLAFGGLLIAWLASTNGV
jgi:phosphatidylglycerol:prolipoprotein diacylglycerol transferase